MTRELDPTQMGEPALLLTQKLTSLVVGQESAIRGIAETYQSWTLGLLAPGRPIGSFLFMGPTGTGKTYLVQSLASVLLGNEKAALLINCGEYQHGHEISKLTGSPPGYLGHRETHPLLSQARLDQYYTSDVKLSIVLFDEIEKAHDNLWQLLLGILDRADLMLGDNMVTDFSRTLIFMTGNVGGTELSEQLGTQGPGFAPSAWDPKKATRATLERIRKRFTPEFFNRIDRVEIFQPLTSSQLDTILGMELARILIRAGHPGLMTERARSLLLKEGTDARYGARHLRRTLEKRLVQPLANLMATHQLKAGEALTIDAAEGELLFKRGIK